MALQKAMASARGRRARRLHQQQDARRLGAARRSRSLAEQMMESHGRGRMPSVRRGRRGVAVTTRGGD